MNDDIEVFVAYHHGKQEFYKGGYKYGKRPKVYSQINHINNALNQGPKSAEDCVVYKCRLSGWEEV